MKKLFKCKLCWIVFSLIILAIIGWVIFAFATGRNPITAEPTPIDVEQEIASIEPYKKFANIKENIVYAKVDGVELKLDLYYPKNIKKDVYPLIIYVHGGGWYSGDKTILDQVGSCQHAIRSGFAVASINHRLVPQAYSAEPVKDIGKAIAYLRDNGSTYNLKTEKIGLMASSSGAQLAAMHVLTVTDPKQMVQAVALIAPPTDLSAKNWSGEMRKCIDRYLHGQNPDLASPIKNIPSTTLPTFLLVQGDKDKVVPTDQAYNFNQALVAKKVKSTYLKVKNAGHDFNPNGGEMKPSKIGVAETTTQLFQKNIK